jgi:hypothetical protein
MNQRVREHPAVAAAHTIIIGWQGHLDSHMLCCGRCSPAISPHPGLGGEDSDWSGSSGEGLLYIVVVVGPPVEECFAGQEQVARVSQFGWWVGGGCDTPGGLGVRDLGVR